MKICALPHATWNPDPDANSSRSSLRDLFGMANALDALDLPLRNNEATHFFVCQAYDLFEQRAQFIERVFAVMAEAAQHEFQLETARADRVLALGNGLLWADNIWLGVRLYTPTDAVRIDALRRSGARVRFVALEDAALGDGLDLHDIHFVIAPEEQGVSAALRDRCAGAGARLFAGELEDADEIELPALPGRVITFPPRGGR